MKEAFVDIVRSPPVAEPLGEALRIRRAERTAHSPQGQGEDLPPQGETSGELQKVQAVLFPQGVGVRGVPRWVPIVEGGKEEVLPEAKGPENPTILVLGASLGGEGPLGAPGKGEVFEGDPPLPPPHGKVQTQAEAVVPPPGEGQGEVSLPVGIGGAHQALGLPDSPLGPHWRREGQEELPGEDDPSLLAPKRGEEEQKKKCGHSPFLFQRTLQFERIRARSPLQAHSPPEESRGRIS